MALRRRRKPADRPCPVATDTSAGPTDLTVTVESAPAWTVVGQTIHVSWTATNQGDIATDATWLDHVYLSSDMALDAADTLEIKEQ